ncbi:MAG TPA: DUF6677 family protein [Pyrinomonadaceae bacterium]|jgi:hypothetical protein
MALRIDAEKEQGSAKAWLAGILAWLVPGGGHLLLGRYGRGLLLGGVVYLLYIVGLLLGGHLYGPHNADETGLLAYVFGLCDLGSGLLYLTCLWGGIGLVDQASRATAEYGNIFIMVAGLLNYLLALDAYDLSAGRKA